MRLGVGIFSITILLIIGYKIFGFIPFALKGAPPGALSTVTVEERYMAPKAGPGILGAGGEKALFPVAGEGQKPDVEKSTRLVMMIIISLVLLLASLLVVLSKKFDESSKRWAFGTIGTIVGFWLK